LIICCVINILIVHVVDDDDAGKESIVLVLEDLDLALEELSRLMSMVMKL